MQVSLPTYVSHAPSLILISLIILTLSCEEYSLRSSSSYNFLHHPFRPSLDVQIFSCSISSQNTLNLCSFIRGRERDREKGPHSVYLQENSHSCKVLQRGLGTSSSINKCRRRYLLSSDQDINSSKPEDYRNNT
jgi:hypothetical protein